MSFSIDKNNNPEFHHEKHAEHILSMDRIASAPDKLIRWKKKLLDLTASSSLVNLRVDGISKRAGCLLTDQIYDFYNRVKKGNIISLTSSPREYRNSIDSADLLSDMEAFAADCSPIIQSALEQNLVYLVYEKTDTDELLHSLMKADKEYRNQFGTGILYLSFGTVRWFDEKNGENRYAPVLFVPVICVRNGEQFQVMYEKTGIFLNAGMTELLKNRFGLRMQSLSHLSMEEDGPPDLKEILTKLREICSNCSLTEVFDYSSIGIFHFSQYLLWNDLDKCAEVFRNHPVIHSMIENMPLLYAASKNTVYENQENELFIPMPADQSQVEAVRQAMGHQSFVLHGPPGTGKSQTITMMLANFIGNGKGVLFSAEKPCAMQVVYERLQALGLNDFCILLNTNAGKSNAAAKFLSHYERLMELPEEENADYNKLSKKVEEKETELKKLLSIFEQQTEDGIRFLDVLTCRIRQMEKNGSGLKKRINDADKTLFQEHYREKLYILKETADIGNLLGNPGDFPLAKWTGLQYRYGISDIIGNLTGEYLVWLDKLESVFETIRLMAENEADSANPVQEKNRTEKLTPKVIMDQLIHIAEIPEEIRRLPNLYVKLLTWQKYVDIKGEAQKLNRLVKPGFLELDLDTIQSRWKRIRHKVDIGSRIARMDMKDTVKAYMVNPAFTDRDFDDALYAGILVNRSGLPTTLSYSFPFDKEETTRILQVLEKYFRKGIRLPFGAEDGILQEHRQVLKDYFSFTENMCRELDCRIPFWNGETEIETARQEAERWPDACDLLREWCDYSKLRDSCRQEGLGSWIARLEAGETIETVFAEIEKENNAFLLDRFFSEHPEICDFAGYRYDILTEQYDKLLQEYYEVCAREIRCRQIHRIHRALADPANAEQIILLKKMIASRGKGISIRSVFEHAGPLLIQMTPCIIASPLQAAQCIPLNQIYFDHMVLDEASQLQTARAVGLIVRSHHSIVVGDPNQMPPTDFFGASCTDEEEDFKEADQESVLMDFIALNIPDVYLKWHYRSHHESLIDFSNKNYYDGKIITFPSVDAFQSRVNTVFCNGIYDRGSTMTNRMEAEKLVEYLVSQLSAGDKRSYGVIAFNSHQQLLIQQLMEKQSEENSTFVEALFSLEKRGETVFVRNLESVQGDERDVILFSVGYGPDREGKLLMNFGPLARSGGYRRLNVAVTRAKDEMILFTSMKSADMKLNEMAPRGVKDLKKFLEYAENGGIEPINKHGKHISENQEHHREMPEDDFRKTVCDFLSDHHIPHGVGIGQSDLRIDIAVYSETKQRYILGILLNSKAVNGRFSIYDSEIGMMKKLAADGWTMVRIWAIDWIENPEREKKRLLSRIEQVMKEE